MVSEMSEKQTKNSVKGRNNGTLNPIPKGVSGNPNGRPKGTLNRGSIVRRWLEASEQIKNPITGISERLTQYDIITLGLIKKARAGDVQALRELMDSSFGKIPDKLQTENKTELNLDMSTDELNSILKKLDKL
jgi:hypothetical protein